MYGDTSEKESGKYSPHPTLLLLSNLLGHLPLAEPVDKPEDRAALWHSPGAKKRMGKGRKLI